MKNYLLALPIACCLVAPLCAIGGRAQRQNQDNKPERPKASHDVTPAAGPVVTRAADPYITLDFIWWRAQEDGLAYAFNGNSIADAPPLVPAFPPGTADKGSIKYPHFNYKPGFKAGFGLQFQHDGWDLFAQYTWWRNNKGSSKTKVHRDVEDFDSFVIVNIACSSSALGTAPATAASALTNTDVVRATGQWQLHFNAIDLELGRNFWISERLTLRPFVGLKGSWMKQDFDVLYNQIFVQPLFNLALDMDIRQWGVGLRTGVDTAWYMTKNWSLFGEFAISGLCNHFSTSRKDFFTNDGIVVDQRITYLKNSINTVTAIVEWGLGFRYETLFYNDDYLYLLQAGWEQQIWFDQNRFAFMPNSVPGNLNFQGLTVKTGLYF